MARKQSNAQQAEPETQSQGSAQSEGGQDASGRISKSEAVRRALAVGISTPAEGVSYIKDNFGLQVGPQHFSAVKSDHIKRTNAGPPGRRGRPKSEATSTATPAAPRVSSARGEADVLAAMEAMKPLVDSLGADKVKRIVDLLG